MLIGKRRNHFPALGPDLVGSTDSAVNDLHAAADGLIACSCCNMLTGAQNSNAALTRHSAAASLRALRPVPSVSLQGTLDVAGQHRLSYTVYGNPDGFPAVFLHGGPGAGCYPNHARFFDVQHYKVILIDQRGCGGSTPRGCLVNNTTSSLVADLEKLREHLQLDRWLVLGGSWGVTLALAYARAHPSSVAGLILRGLCLMRPKEIEWMYGGGCGMLKPLAWARFIHHLPLEDRSDPLLGYYKQLLSEDATVRDAAAKSWMEWEMAVGFSSPSSDLLVWDGSSWHQSPHPTDEASRQPPRPQTPPQPAIQAEPSSSLQGSRQSGSVATVLEARDTTQSPSSQSPSASPGAGAKAPTCPVPTLRQLPPDLAARSLAWAGDPSMSSSTAQALLECHYSVHGGFLLDQPLLDPAGIEVLRSIPSIAVQGQRDLVCPPGTAYELHSAWPEMELRLVPNAGHSMYDPAIAHELLEATDVMKQLCTKQSGAVVRVGGGAGTRKARSSTTAARRAGASQTGRR